MPDEVSSDAGRRFASDLRAIREARGVSIKDLHDETKIPVGLLESFETTGLFDHPMFNRVYLRSFVRTYAEVTQISPSVALGALEEALDGSYTDRLAVEYLGKPGAGTEAERTSEERPVEEPSSAAAPSAASESDERQEPAQPQPGPAETPAAETATETPAERRAAPPRPQERTASPSESARRSPVPTGETPRRQWIIVAVVGLVLVGGVWALISFVGGDDEAPDVADTEAVRETTVADTSAAARTPTPDRPAVSIGDSLDVRVVSTGEPVRWLRVTADDDVRRPYWIEADQSRLFQAAERLIIEDAPPDEGTLGQLERIRLEVEGAPYPVDRRDDQGRIVLTRDALASYYSSAQ